ncbi:MAG: M48 family metallopeptidase [Clostridia bacterium]|nr:M48 family metallopeptidase [Clostridia bacterium]
MDLEIIRSKRKTFEIQIKKDRVIVRVPFYAAKKDIDTFISRHSEWIDRQTAKLGEARRERENVKKLTEKEIADLYEKAKKVIPERVAYYAPTIGVKYGRISIRKQKTRWGSCSAKGNLSFNCLLMLAPCEVADSVVVHELCHIKEMNHSKKFYDEVLKVFPSYKEQRNWLKINGEKLLAMADL